MNSMVNNFINICYSMVGNTKANNVNYAIVNENSKRSIGLQLGSGVLQIGTTIGEIQSRHVNCKVEQMLKNDENLLLGHIYDENKAEICYFFIDNDVKEKSENKRFMQFSIRKPMVCTEKGIHIGSTYGEFKKHYSIKTMYPVLNSAGKVECVDIKTNNSCLLFEFEPSHKMRSVGNNMPLESILDDNSKLTLIRYI